MAYRLGRRGEEGEEREVWWNPLSLSPFLSFLPLFLPLSPPLFQFPICTTDPFDFSMFIHICT